MTVVRTGPGSWIRKGSAGAAEMAQQEKVLTSFSEDLSLALIMLFTVTSAVTPAAGDPKLSLNAVATVVRHAHGHARSHTHTHAHTYTNLNIKKT